MGGPWRGPALQFDRYLVKRVVPAPATVSVKAFHSSEEKTRADPSGSFESRTPTIPRPRKATSTHSWLPPLWLDSLTFMVPVGVLTAVSASVIGVGCWWWPPRESRPSVAALRHRIELEAYCRGRS